MGVTGSVGNNQSRHVFSRLFGIAGCIGNPDLADPLHLGSLLGNGGTIGAGYQNLHLTANFGRSGQGIESGSLEMLVVVFGNNEDGHDQITLASFLSLLTSSATSATLTPALRLGGSETFRVVRRGVTSTPRSAGLKVSSGFFLAFMMFGSVA